MAERPKILAVKLSSLGDLFHALPAVAALGRELGAEVDWVTQREYVGLVGCFDPVGRVLAFPRRGWLCEGRGFVRALRDRRYDAVLDFQGLLKSAVVCRLARTSLRIGPASLREVPRGLYSRLAEGGRGPHAVEGCLALAESFGVSVDAVEFPVSFPAVGDVGDLPLLGVAPCSRWGSKNWPEGMFVEALREVQASVGCRVVLLGGAGDGDVCGRIADGLEGEVVNLAGRCSLVELGGWIAGLSCLITNDSGPMHMAVAVAVPLVALFGPTDPERTGPYGRMDEVLQPEAVFLEGVSHRDYKRLDDGLIGRISVERVVEATLGVLGRVV